MKAFVDTNIIIDALASRKPFSEDAEKIFLLAAKEKIEAYISASVVTDIYYILRKFSSENTARGYILKLFQIFKVLPVSEDACIAALESPIPDYEDGLQDICACLARCDCIITRDENFLKYSSLAISPTGFLAKLEL